MDLTLLEPLACLHRIEMPSHIEMNLAKNYLMNSRSQNGNPEKSILDRLYPVRHAYEKVYKLFCAVETFACSTAVVECSFSCLSRVGIIGRMHMLNERMRNLTFLAFESKELNKIDEFAILRHFNAQKNRRLQIF